MSDLPAGLRDRLAERVPISTLQVDQEAQSRDGTVKVLLRTGDGHAVETVLMTYRDGAALAVPFIAVRLPADLHVLCDRADALRAQPDPR